MRKIDESRESGRMMGVDDDFRVDVSPEMIKAGVSAYEATRPGEASGFNDVEVVTEVYRTMRRAAPADWPQNPPADWEVDDWSC